MGYCVGLKFGREQGRSAELELELVRNTGAWLHAHASLLGYAADGHSRGKKKMAASRLGLAREKAGLCWAAWIWVAWVWRLPQAGGLVLVSWARGCKARLVQA